MPNKPKIGQHVIVVRNTKKSPTINDVVGEFHVTAVGRKWFRTDFSDRVRFDVKTWKGEEVFLGYDAFECMDDFKKVVESASERLNLFHEVYRSMSRIYALRDMSIEDLRKLKACLSEVGL